jgi:hypothetical protein
MVKLWTLVALMALGACNSGPPANCKVAGEQAMQCIERYSGKSDDDMLPGCFPFSKPERIFGAWVSGFETNEFYEGEQASPALVNKHGGHTELELEDVGSTGPFPVVFDMEFIGRRSQCDMGVPRHIILVDQLISRQERSAN